MYTLSKHIANLVFRKVSRFMLREALRGTFHIRRSATINKTQFSGEHVILSPMADLRFQVTNLFATLKWMNFSILLEIKYHKLCLIVNRNIVWKFAWNQELLREARAVGQRNQFLLWCHPFPLQYPVYYFLRAKERIIQHIKKVYPF